MVSNHVLAMVMRDTEIFTNLELTQAVFDQLRNDAFSTDTGTFDMALRQSHTAHFEQPPTQ